MLVYKISGNDRALKIILTVNKDSPRCSSFPWCVIIFKTGWKTRILCFFPTFLSSLSSCRMPAEVRIVCCKDCCFYVLKSFVLFRCVWEYESGLEGRQWICGGLSSICWTYRPRCVYLCGRKWKGSRHKWVYRWISVSVCLPMWAHIPVRDSLCEKHTCLPPPHPFICCCRPPPSICCFLPRWKQLALHFTKSTSRLTIWSIGKVRAPVYSMSLTLQSQ